MNKTLKLVVVLFLITAISGAILAFSNNITQAIIIANEEKASSGPDVAAAVIPGAVSIEKFDEALVEKIKAENAQFVDLRICKDASGKELGYGIRTKSTENGYGGEIEIYLGISMDGEILGMKVLAHSETPGLGSNIENPDFQTQFIGRKADGEIGVAKSSPADNEIQALAGATFSSNSVTSAVNNAIKVYNDFVK